jgi:CRP/FNR family cyclic AMP-dependent transcriptional regulator
VNKVPPFMGDFSDEDVEWVVRNGVQRRVAAGEAIIEEGQPVHDVFVILDGSFVVSSNALSVKLERRLERGEIAGEMSFINNQLPAATVRAETDSVVFCIPRSRLGRKIAEDAGFAGRFHTVVSEFTVDRLYGWRGMHGGARDGEDDSAASLRVHELIEKMLRGEFP